MPNEQDLAVNAALQAAVGSKPKPILEGKMAKIESRRVVGKDHYGNPIFAGAAEDED